MMENEYRFNVKFRNFVDQFADEKGISVEDAFKEERVKHVFLHLADL